MSVQINYIKSNLVYPACTEIQDTYIVTITRTTKIDREASLNNALKEITK